MKFEKKLSVIVMCYKFKDYIVQCIDSVLAQNIDHEMEIVVRDDGTSDGTYELLLEKYSQNSKVKILDSSNNYGAYNNFLTIYKECSGEYIAYIDGDDYLTDDAHYQNAINFLDENKNYVVYSAGYRYLENNIISPQDGWMQSAKPDAELNDMIVENYVSFGRVYRNVTIDVDLIKNQPYPDWAFLFELMRHGKSYCNQTYCCGIYRIHSGGVYAGKSNEYKLAQKEKMRSELMDRLNVSNIKVITIVDSFAYNQKIRNKLYDAVKWMKEDGHDILLVSNTTVDKEILNDVNFYLYDKRNQLFQEKYENNDMVVFFKHLVDGVVIHDVVPVIQKHGLSVLINLFNALTYAKAQGYTHFQRFEVDDIFGKKARQFIKQVPRMCMKENKNGLLYYNEEHSPADISFHYFYCKIDDFLAKIPRISNEQDYVEYLKKYYGNKKFQIVEVFIRENLRRNGDSEFLIRSGKEHMFADLADTAWNTETSISSFDSKYGKCTTRLYHVNEYNKESNSFNRANLFMICTYSYHSEKVVRRIIVTKNNGETFDLIHVTEVAGGWSWNEVASDIQSISVYENDRFLYKEYAADCISHVNITRK